MCTNVYTYLMAQENYDPTSFSTRTVTTKPMWPRKCKGVGTASGLRIQYLRTKLLLAMWFGLAPTYGILQTHKRAKEWEFQELLT